MRLNHSDGLIFDLSNWQLIHIVYAVILTLIYQSPTIVQKEKR